MGILGGGGWHVGLASHGVRKGAKGAAQKMFKKVLEVQSLKSTPNSIHKIGDHDDVIMG